MFLVRFTSCYLAFTSLKLVLMQSSETCVQNHLQQVAQYRAPHPPHPPGSISVPRGQAGHFSPHARKVRVNVDLRGLPWVPERRTGSRPSGLVRALGGSPAAFFLPRPPRSCSQWNNMHLLLWNGKTRSLFSCLLKGSGQRGVSLRKRVWELQEVAIKLLYPALESMREFKNSALLYRWGRA